MQRVFAFLIMILLFSPGGGAVEPYAPGVGSGVLAKADDDLCLFLNGGRFQTSVKWKADRGDDFRDAQGVLLDTETGFDETGYFWFSDPDDIDLVVRVFDGCQFNDHFWVFHGALTDVEYEITVTDTQTSLTKTYSNPLGKIAPPIQDTQAFATCPAPLAKTVSPVEITSNKMGCTPAGDMLCLADGRFQVEVDWKIPGESGKGMVGVSTDRSGAFWFRDRSDLNIYVKIVDGRAVNGHFWLTHTTFTGAEFDLRVTDTQTGLVRTYHNELEQTSFGTDYFLTGSQDQQVLYPWVSDSAQFDSVLVTNNSNCIDTDVVLEATRGDGITATATRTIPALGFLEEASADLFPELSGGSGYSVLLTSPSPGVLGRWVTNNLNTPSRNSPSQGVAVNLPETITRPLPDNARVGNAIQFGYLPNRPEFFTGTVVVNVGDAPTDVTLFFYDAIGNLLDTNQTAASALSPFEPFAAVSRDLVPGNLDSVSMVAYSPDQPLTGVTFVFNSDGEPAIGNATAIDFVPPK